ncbi:MAG: hypothetical protein KC506_02525 [Nanoarchaeota archaeon]|nr:hypothetical protein [Nanoarchaeota archaeon]
MRRNKIVLLVAVFVVIVAASFYYIAHQSEIGRRSNLVGDGLCGNYIRSEDRDGCCANVHEGDVTIQCVGSWDYVTGIQFCEFVCEDEEPKCPEDAKICDNGNVVERNASNECFFDGC